MGVERFNTGDVVATSIVALLFILFFVSFFYFIMNTVKRKTTDVNNSTAMEQTLKNIERQNEEIIELLKKNNN